MRLNHDQVDSLIARQLGITVAGTVTTERNLGGVVEWYSMQRKTTKMILLKIEYLDGILHLSQQEEAEGTRL